MYVRVRARRLAKRAWLFRDAPSHSGRVVEATGTNSKARFPIGVDECICIHAVSAESQTMETMASVQGFIGVSDHQGVYGRAVGRVRLLKRIDLAMLDERTCFCCWLDDNLGVENTAHAAVVCVTLHPA